jgi:chromosome segregation ATPase
MLRCVWCCFLQSQLQEAQAQLESCQASLKDATSDRDMFLRRLQQLEQQQEQQQDDPAVPRPLSRLEAQRQKAHAAQVSRNCNAKV